MINFLSHIRVQESSTSGTLDVAYPKVSPGTSVPFHEHFALLESQSARRFHWTTRRHQEILLFFLCLLDSQNSRSENPGIVT